MRMTTPAIFGRNRSAPADATLTVRRISPLTPATDCEAVAGVFEIAVALVVVLARLLGVEAQQHVERRQHQRTLAGEQAEVGEGLERHGIEDGERPAIEQERDGAYVPQRDRQRLAPPDDE